MTRITYPTKGYTKISYEQNEIKTQNIINSDYYNTVPLGAERRFRLTGEHGVSGAPPQNEIEFRLFIEYPTVAKIRHETSVNFDTGTGHFSMSLNREDGACPYSSFYPSDFPFPPLKSDYYTYAQALRTSTQSYNSFEPDSNLNSNVPALCPTLAFEIGPDGSYAIDGGVQTVSGNSGGRVLLLPGTYVFRIQSLYNKTTDGYAEIVFQLQEDLSAPPEYVNKVVGGIRVEKMIDYESEGVVARTQHFEYNDEEGFSTAVENLVPLSKKVGSVTSYHSGNPSILYFEYHNLLFDNFTAYNPSIGIPVYYSAINRYIENENDQGSTTTHYAYTGIFNTPTWHKIPQGEYFNKGRVVNAITKKGNGPDSNQELDTLVIVKNTYAQIRGLLNGQTLQDLNPKHPPSLIIDIKRHRQVFFDRYSYPQFPPDDSQELQAIMDLHKCVVIRLPNLGTIFL